MKLVWKGEFSGSEDDLPQREHPSNSVPFKEMSANRMVVAASIASIFVAIALLVILALRGMTGFSSWGIIAALIAVIPHEFLHAICFKEAVHVYSWLKRGAFFVVGTETMTKARFVFLSLLPNIVFGFIPYAIAFIFPEQAFFGWFGSLSLAMGMGDYYNVFNALTQVPKGALIYLSGFHSYWYMPETVREV